MFQKMGKNFYLILVEPLKSLIHSDFIKDWCINNNVIFKSDENFRHNVKEMIKAWNKKYPKDKIPEKLK